MKSDITQEDHNFSFTDRWTGMTYVFNLEHAFAELKDEIHRQFYDIVSVSGYYKHVNDRSKYTLFLGEIQQHIFHESAIGTLMISNTTDSYDSEKLFGFTITYVHQSNLLHLSINPKPKL